MWLGTSKRGGLDPRSAVAPPPPTHTHTRTHTHARARTHARTLTHIFKANASYRTIRPISFWGHALCSDREIFPFASAYFHDWGAFSQHPVRSYKETTSNSYEWPCGYIVCMSYRWMWLNTYHEGVWGSTDPLVLKPSLIGGGVTFMLWLLYFRYQLGRCSGHGRSWQWNPVVHELLCWRSSQAVVTERKCILYTVHISVYIILSVLVDRSHLDMEVSAENKHDRRVGVSADCAMQLSFSASVLVASWESLAWFLSSRTERERERAERTCLNTKMSYPL